MNKRTGWAFLIGFILTIPLANAWLKHFGLWRVPGLGPVASGVIWVGLAFVLRDVAQLILGRRWAWFDASPSGQLTMTIMNPQVFGYFTPGTEYRVTIEKIVPTKARPKESA